jgi:hypothetical protein
VTAATHLEAQIEALGKAIDTQASNPALSGFRATPEPGRSPIFLYPVAPTWRT